MYVLALRWTVTIGRKLLTDNRASLVAQMVKNLPAMQETPVPSLGREDTLEKEMATYSSILAWEMHGQRSQVGYSPWDCKESDTTERLSTAQSTEEGERELFNRYRVSVLQDKEVLEIYYTILCISS